MKASEEAFSLISNWRNRIKNSGFIIDSEKILLDCLTSLYVEHEKLISEVMNSGKTLEELKDYIRHK